MRFTLVSIIAAALVGSAASAPVGTSNALAERSLITDLGNIVGNVIDGLNLRDLELQLNKLLGGSLVKLEDALGVTFAEKLLGLYRGGASKGTIQAIGEAVGMLIDGLSLETVNAWLDKQTNGAVSDLEKVLGIPDILKVLGLQ